MKTVEAQRRVPAPAEQRGYRVVFRPGERNFCPGCGREHWWVGRSSAECGFCQTAIPFAHAGRAA